MPHPAPDRAEVAVVGAGPAGLAAAVTAADAGLDVLLIDAADAPGGQYYRAPAPGLGA
ncbi:NAD(P)-binding protein, partial [Streptomyces sp. SID2563]|uniref:FAD-dependent oxidoreductase n=2 Tax=unclassified Streptomyces TaxID=2593676 RepID=UPI00136CEC32